MNCDTTKPTNWLYSKRRLRLAWASAWYDQSLRCPYGASLAPWLPFNCLAKSLIRLVEDSQADLSLRWAHNHIVGFVVLRLKCYTICTYRALKWTDASPGPKNQLTGKQLPFPKY